MTPQTGGHEFAAPSQTQPLDATGSDHGQQRQKKAEVATRRVTLWHYVRKEVWGEGEGGMEEWVCVWQLLLEMAAGWSRGNAQSLTCGATPLETIFMRQLRYWMLCMPPMLRNVVHKVKT